MVHHVLVLGPAPVLGLHTVEQGQEDGRTGLDTATVEEPDQGHRSMPFGKSDLVAAVQHSLLAAVNPADVGPSSDRGVPGQ